jgi:hypothetical protein
MLDLGNEFIPYIYNRNIEGDWKRAERLNNAGKYKRTKKHRNLKKLKKLKKSKKSKKSRKY